MESSPLRHPNPPELLAVPRINSVRERRGAASACMVLTFLLWIYMAIDMDLYLDLWLFPRIGVPLVIPLVIIHFSGIFHEINHPL